MKSITGRILVALLLTTGLAFTTISANPKVDPDTKRELLELKSQKAKLETQEKMLKVKTALELREDQMAAWNDYETYMLNEQSERHIMMKEMQERRINNEEPPTSLELAQKNVERLERQLENARQRLVVYGNLYSVLDDDQRQKLDKLANKKVKRMARELRKRKKSDRPNKPSR